MRSPVRPANCHAPRWALMPVRVAAFGLLAALGAAGFAPAVNSATSAAGPVVEIAGTLLVIYGDDFERKRADVMHFVQDRRTGRMVRLHFAAPPRGLGQSGRQIRLRGRWSGDEFVLEPGYEALTSDGSSGTSSSTTLSVSGVTGQRDTLVMLGNFRDANLSCSTQSVRDLMFTDPNGKSVDDLFRATSQGKVSIVGQVAAPVTIDYSGATACEFNNWAEAMRAQVALQGIDPAAYPHHVYVLPPASSCPWVGLGSVGGTATASWVLRCEQPDVYAHEIGHNIGMQHASTATNEYGDASDIMGTSGYQLREVNGPHLEQMGWRPASRLQNLTASGTYDIAPLAMGDSTAVAPQVLEFPKPDTGESYYVSYRTAVGFDTGLYSTYLNRVSVHRYANDGGKTVLVARLDPGQTYTDSANGISVSHVSRTSDYATVQVQLAGSTATTCTRQAPSLAISPSSQSAAAGQTLRYTVSIANRDSAACAASTLAVSGTVPAGWSGTISQSSVALSPGASAAVTLAMTSPATAASGTYAGSVAINDSAVAVHTASVTAGYVVQTACTRGSPRVALSPSSQSAAPGQGLTYVGTVTNTDGSGCASSTFSLSGSVPSGWLSSLGSGSVTLSPGNSVQVQFSVTSPGTAAAATYGVRMDAVHGSDAARTGSAAGTYQVVSTADTTAPTAPTGLSGSYNSKQKRVSLSWQASTDNVAVIAYRVYRDGVALGETAGTTYVDSAVTQGTSYTYTVRARDAAGNLSATSAGVTILTSTKGRGGK